MATSYKSWNAEKVQDKIVAEIRNRLKLPTRKTNHSLWNIFWHEQDSMQGCLRSGDF